MVECAASAWSMAVSPHPAAKAGIQERLEVRIPAFAGMTQGHAAAAFFESINSYCLQKKLKYELYEMDMQNATFPSCWWKPTSIVIIRL
jgi:hypothetical protein